MLKKAFTAAALAFVVLLLGAFLIGALGFENGEMAAAGQSFDFLQADQAAAENPAENLSNVFIIIPDDQGQIEFIYESRANQAFILSPAPANSIDQIAIIRLKSNAIAAIARPFNLKRAKARGLDRLKFVI